MKKSKGKKVDEIHLPHMAPAWVLRLAEQRKGLEPCFIMAKTLTKTDLDARQNRILIPYAFVKAHLIPFLFKEDKAAANLLDQERKCKKPILEGRDAKKMKLVESGSGVQEPGEEEASNYKKEARRMHGGLHVPVYVGASLRKAYVIMTRWDSSNGTILKGNEYSKYLIRWSGIKVGDKVMLWGFREGEMETPCFVLHRIEEEAVIECSQGGGPSV